jgi:hypothetical protein
LTLAIDLLKHALALVDQDEAQLDEVRLRRTISACYYALFHQINGDAAKLIAPNVPAKTNHRIQRWFEHSEMKRICGRFIPAQLDHPLLGLIGSSPSSDLQTVARNFIQLQDARHSADYDLSYQLNKTDAMRCVGLTVETMKAWKNLEGSAEANIFILSLLLWKNWEKDW